MQLNITNPTANSFNKAVGISEERSNELAAALDKLVVSYGSGPVRSCDVFNDIAHLCNNIEELVFCTINHCNWHFLRGHLFTVK